LITFFFKNILKKNFQKQIEDKNIWFKLLIICQVSKKMCGFFLCFRTIPLSSFRLFPTLFSFQW